MALSPDDKLTAGNAATVRHALDLIAADPQSDVQAALRHAEQTVPVSRTTSRVRWKSEYVSERRATYDGSLMPVGPDPLDGFPDFADGMDEGRQARREAWAKHRASERHAERREALPAPPDSLGRSGPMFPERQLFGRLRKAWQAAREAWA